MNRQKLPDSEFFGMRNNKVKWPTLRKAYLTDDNVEKIKKWATGKGRSIIFLDGDYETKLNRYVGKDPIERSIFFEFMCREKGVKGAIFAYCWIGNFHNGSIAHFSFQFPQMNCWTDNVNEANAFFERASFRMYDFLVETLYDGDIVDDEVKKFVENGRELINEHDEAVKLAAKLAKAKKKKELAK
jgi:hypothetical protein